MTETEAGDGSRPQRNGRTHRTKTPAQTYYRIPSRKVTDLHLDPDCRAIPADKEPIPTTADKHPNAAVCSICQGAGNTQFHERDVHDRLLAMDPEEVGI